ncbi:MAG: sel1 repeat family protein [Proteobacteria bacterium]|nr:sel1 repeat family protein [Pseudomonadota bacterium]
MKTHTTSSFPLRAGLFALALAACLPATRVAVAQSAPQPAVHAQTAAQRHADGVAMERRKDDAGAIIAFTEAAQNGYGPAQRKLGDIYGHGNAAVTRDYEESLRWYQLARDNGEDVPPIQPRMPSIDPWRVR